MAENTETIILEINATDALNQIAQMQKEMEMLRAKQKEFTTDSQDYQKLASEIRILNKDQSDLKRSLDASVKARKEELDTVTFSNNSIKQNRELLKELTAQYINMKQPNGALTAQIKSLSDTLKKQEADIGDNRRAVGSYKEAITSAFGELKIGGVSMNALAQGLQASKAGFMAAEGGAKGFGAALVATGLPVIIMGIQALIDVLSQIKPIADAVENAVVGIKAAFGALISGGDMQEAVRLQTELLEVTRDLEDTQKAFNIQMEASNRQISSLIVQSKRKGISDKEALGLIQQANQIEQDVFNKRQERNKIELDTAFRAFKQKYKLSREEIATLLYTTGQEALIIRKRIEDNTAYNEDELNKLQDLALEREKIRTESVALQDKLANREAAITERAEAKQAKAAEDAAKRKEEAREREAKAEEARKKSIQDAQAAFDEAVKQQAESEKKYTDLIISIGKKNADATKQQLEQSVQNFDRDKNRRELALKLIQEQNMTLEQINKEFAQSDFKTFEDFYKAKTAAAKKAADEQTAIAKKQADDDKAIQEAKFAAATSIVNALTQINQAVLGNSAAGLAFQKALALADIGISTATAIASVVAAATKDALSSPLGIIQLVASVATGIATVTANIMKATQLLSSANTPEAPELQTFEDGGEVLTVGGKRHRDGGTKFVGSDGTRFEAEQGEKIFVMKRTAAANIGRLSAFNQLYGGNAWDNNMTRYAEDGGLVFDGGMTTRSMSQPDLAAQIQQAVANMPAPVVSVKEINTVNTRRTIAQEQAGL